MRIWPVRDVIEPRIKVEGPGVAIPGICGRDIATVGTGRTHRLAGMGVVEVSSVNWHDSGGDFVETYLDMSGPYAEMYPYVALHNLCAVVEPDRALNDEARNDAVHAAALAVSDHVAAATLGLTPPEVQEWSLRPVDPALPKVVYIWGVHSPQAMSGSMTAFCTATYGLTRLTPPWLLHPNEIIDGALSGPVPDGLRHVVDGGQQPALPRPLPPPRPRLELPRRDRAAHRVDDPAREAHDRATRPRSSARCWGRRARW